MKFTDEMPGRMKRLRTDRHSRPVPWFVAWIDGEPDFRVVRPGALQFAVSGRLCWVCGIPFQRQEDRAFVIGPMCAVNRVSSEPPSHLDCAVWSAKNCPFLATPRMVRRERHLPGGAVNPAGTMIRRNPGVGLVWVTGYKSWRPFRDNSSGGTLFDVGEPKRALWFAQGAPATREQVLASIDSGLPLLLETAADQGPDAIGELARLHQQALAFIPAAAPALHEGTAS